MAAQAVGGRAIQHCRVLAPGERLLVQTLIHFVLVDLIPDITSVAQVGSVVGLDEPLFQPFPPQVTFHNPQAFQAHETLLYLRNNDKVSSSNYAGMFITKQSGSELPGTL